MEKNIDIPRGKISRPQIFIRAFDNILDSIREPLVVLDTDLKVLLTNQAFHQTFDVRPDETEGMVIYDLGNRQWDIPKLRELLEVILPERTELKDLEVEHEFQTIGRKILRLNARRILRKSKEAQMILLVFEDVTEQEDQKRDLEELVEDAHSRTYRGQGRGGKGQTHC